MPNTSIDEIITTIIAREGGFVKDKDDKGGRTFMGISERSNPDLWADGVVTEAEARERYMKRYVQWPGFDQITDPQLQMQLIDFGVHSGSYIAIQKLQQIVGVTQDGVLGPQTLAAIKQMHPEDVNNALAILRIKMIGKIVQRNPSQLKFLGGWLDRALQFIS